MTNEGTKALAEDATMAQVAELRRLEAHLRELSAQMTATNAALAAVRQKVAEALGISLAPSRLRPAKATARGVVDGHWRGGTPARVADHLRRHPGVDFTIAQMITATERPVGSVRMAAALLSKERDSHVRRVGLGTYRWEP